MVVDYHGKPNYQRLAETWMGLLAARDGMSIVPGSVKVELKGEKNESVQGIQQGHDLPQLPV